MQIVQTRPQGEKSAVEGLGRRRVPAVSPAERVLVRRQVKGSTECVERDVKLLPGYVVADSSRSDLDAAIADMSVREPRRDVQRVIGFASPTALSGVMSRHGCVRDVSPPQIVEGGLARITSGPFTNMQARVVALRGARAHCLIADRRINVPISDLEPVTDPQRHPQTK